MSKPRRTFSCFATVALTLVSVLITWTITPSRANARTILLDAYTCDRMAAIAENAPMQSWAMMESPAGQFLTNAVILTQQSRFLIRFPLDKIPKDQQIAYAELVVPVQTYGGNDARFFIWRMLTDWGLGACFNYRTTLGEKIPWAKPGAAGISSDRATRPTATPRLTQNGDVVINVTEDVELWYTGVALNQGWIFTVEDPGTTVQFNSPIWTSQQTTWRLRITYEPKADKK